ncbi:TorF family putative porin [Aestuariibacter sp. AA17]|uniref:TorF family putative porin n=1 Tax=Fluctibacter corallii TaxID=2984329 RepID=A0ABT3A646_9ALTE|nr:TorF family putative porin [Aestuariibacter sp. AA17]MCV2883747.1 TorF family putative porin [Aestuariibacter sp. AA17]
MKAAHTLLIPATFLFSSMAYAELSSTVTFASDYLFNGVSQTDENPALQVSLDWAGESGSYAGAWASNVHFFEGTEIEFDPYVGYYTELSSNLALDVGIAYYTYWGESFSSDYNYPEAWVKFGLTNALGKTDFNFWYTWDYFGLDAKHAIYMINHTFSFDNGVSLLIGADMSVSYDEDKWEWEPGDDNYMHYQITAFYDWKGMTFSLGVQDTDLDTYGDTTVLFTVSKTFSF